MEKQEDFDRIYFERRGDNVKKFIEEAMPISRLGLALSKPWQNVQITCLTGNQHFDAVFEVSGLDSYEMKVEATTIENADAYLRRESLSRKGMVFFDGPISRDGKDIKSTPELVDID
jgi:hypothetical protein